MLTFTIVGVLFLKRLTEYPTRGSPNNHTNSGENSSIALSTRRGSITRENVGGCLVLETELMVIPLPSLLGIDRSVMICTLHLF